MNGIKRLVLVSALAAVSSPALADGFFSQMFENRYEIQRWGFGPNSSGADEVWVFPTGNVNNGQSLLTNTIQALGASEIQFFVRDSLGTANTTSIVIYACTNPAFPSTGTTIDSVTLTADTINCSTSGRIRVCAIGRTGSSSYRLPWSMTILPWSPEQTGAGTITGHIAQNDLLRVNAATFSNLWFRIRVAANSDMKQVLSRVVTSYPNGKPPLYAIIGEN